jgi:uncharacterized protein (DUF433 family)
MSLEIKDLSVPLWVDEYGRVRVGQTRVTLDTVIGAFKRGDTPEQILQDFDTLNLADIYAAVTFYLFNREAVEAYLREQERIGEEIQRQMEAHYPSTGLRERLLARRDASPDKGPKSTCRKS